MTANRDLKRLARERARKTGESYSTALVQVKRAGPRGAAVTAARSEPSTQPINSSWRLRSYSQSGRLVVRVAQEEAACRGLPKASQEHLLLAMSLVPNSVGLAIVERAGITRVALQTAALTHMVPIAHVDQVAVGTLAHTSLAEDAARTLSLAEAEAERLLHARVGVEHVLLGILRQASGRGYDALASLGVTFEMAAAIMASLTPAFTAMRLPVNTPDGGPLRSRVSAL